MKIVLPTALSGTVTGVMLALARAMGETAPVLVLVGYSRSINFDIFNLFNFQGVTAIDQRYTAGDVLPVPGGRQINANGTITDLRDSEGHPFGYRRDLPMDFRCENPLNTPAQIAERCPINYNFRHPTQYQPPRVFRFGIRGTF